MAFASGWRSRLPSMGACGLIPRHRASRCAMRPPAVAAPLVRLLLVAACVLQTLPAFARDLPLDFSPQLPVSSAMAERVRFWIDVFTRVSHTQAVLHDRDDPTL